MTSTMTITWRLCQRAPAPLAAALVTEKTCIPMEVSWQIARFLRRGVSDRAPSPTVPPQTFSTRFTAPWLT